MWLMNTCSILIMKRRLFTNYMPFLKTMLTMGHLSSLSVTVVEILLLGKFNEYQNNPSYTQHFIEVCYFFPLFSGESIQHINNPPIFPRILLKQLGQEKQSSINLCLIFYLQPLSSTVTNAATIV
jgi:hypothetical protein